MAISKVIYKTSAEDTGTVWMDTTDKTVAADKMVSGITALKNDGTTVTGNLTSRSSSDLTASTLTVTAPAGYYGSDATKTLTDANLLAENIKKDISIFGVTGSYEGGGGQTSWQQQYVGSVTVADWGDQLNYIALVDYFSTHSEFAYGEIYRITWKNGTQYTCVAEVEIPDGSWTGYVLGNGELWGEQFGNNEPFIAQQNDNNLLFATTETANTTFTLTIEKQVSGGGSSYTLLYSDEETVSTTSTTNTAVTTLSTGITFGFGETYLVSIRDKAGERNGYFYGSDSYFYVKSNSFANSTTLYGVCYWLDSSGNIDFSNTLRGVFPYRYYGENAMGDIQINSRYDSTRGTVNGTYTIKVYKVTTPEPVT